MRRQYCSVSHVYPCSDCPRLIQVAHILLEQNYCKLRRAFEIVSPTIKYEVSKAIQKLLQIPLVSVQIGSASSGVSFTILLEKFVGTDYLKMASLLNRMTELSAAKSEIGQNMERPFVKMLLNLAQSPRERECLRVAIFKASEISASKARQKTLLTHKTRRNC